jgi:hypothetical protein
MILIPGTKVTVSMKGLAVANYNKKTENWDFALLRGISNHDLKIIVRKYSLTSPGVSETVHIIPSNIKKIEIKNKSTPTQNTMPSYSLDPTFDHNQLRDNHFDSRWISDLCELHGTPAQPKMPIKLKKPSDPKVSLTFLSVSAATLYTKILHENPYFIYDTTDPINRTLLKPLLSTSWAGLDIKWADAGDSTQLLIDGNLINPPLANDADPNFMYHEIEINNNCSVLSSPGDPTDFHHYYEHLVDMNGQKFDEFTHPILENLNMLASFENGLVHRSMFGGKTNDCGIKMISDIDPAGRTVVTPNGLSLEDVLT